MLSTILRSNKSLTTRASALSVVSKNLLDSLETRVLSTLASSSSVTLQNNRRGGGGGGGYNDRYNTFGNRDNRDSRDSRDSRDNRDYRDNRDNRDNRDYRDNRNSRDNRGSYRGDNRGNMPSSTTSNYSAPTSRAPPAISSPPPPPSSLRSPPPLSTLSAPSPSATTAALDEELDLIDGEEDVEFDSGATIDAAAAAVGTEYNARLTQPLEEGLQQFKLRYGLLIQFRHVLEALGKLGVNGALLLDNPKRAFALTGDTDVGGRKDFMTQSIQNGYAVIDPDVELYDLARVAQNHIPMRSLSQHERSKLISFVKGELEGDVFFGTGPAFLDYSTKLLRLASRKSAQDLAEAQAQFGKTADLRTRLLPTPTSFAPNSLEFVRKSIDGE